MPNRKRKRADLSPDPSQPPVAPELEATASHDPEKEQDVWEAFRDENFEAIEQVPLTLHRQYALINELDQQVNTFCEGLLPEILQYIRTRRELSLVRVPFRTDTSENPTLIKEDQRKSLPISTHSALESNGRQSSSQRVSTPSTSKHPETRPMLRRIAEFTQKVLRASEDKVNVAQAANDSVDRHVRILQQAIKEQEASITLGARPGHLEPENLSDLTVGRWVKPSRATLSPINSEDVEGDSIGIQVSPLDDPFPDSVGQIQRLLAKKGRGHFRGIRQLSESQVHPTTTLTITLPAQLANPATDVPEELYCYCNKGSYGEMIACDNKKCPREWYHVGCLGMQTTPEGAKTWYCPDCRPMRRGFKRK